MKILDLFLTFKNQMLAWSAGFGDFISLNDWFLIDTINVYTSTDRDPAFECHQSGKFIMRPINLGYSKYILYLKNERQVKP